MATFRLAQKPCPTGNALDAIGSEAPSGNLDCARGGKTGSDGTEAGTWIVKRFPDTWDEIESLVVSGGRLFFTQSDADGNELWVSDGTEAGSVRLKDIRPGPDGSYPEDLTDIGGILYFNADDGTSGTEPWISDGTTIGTVRLKDVNPGAGSSYPDDFTGVGSSVFFSANDGVHGQELWASDGTETGTHLVSDIAPGSTGANPRYFAAGDGMLFFNANDGTVGQELWGADDTAAWLIKDVRPGSSSSLPEYLAYADGFVYVATSTYDGRVWKSDGTENGTIEIEFDAAGDADARDLHVHNDAVYFSAIGAGDNGPELCRIYGSAAFKVADIEPGPGGSYPEFFASVGPTLFFSASSEATGRELFALVDDGTTGMVEDQVSAPFPSGLHIAPNPTVSVARGRFSMDEARSVTLDILDPSGRRVRRLLQGELSSGEHVVTWDRRSDAAHPAAPGVYFARLTRAGNVTSERIVVVR